MRLSVAKSIVTSGVGVLVVGVIVVAAGSVVAAAAASAVCKVDYMCWVSCVPAFNFFVCIYN